MRSWLREVFEDGFWSGVRYLLFYSWAYARIMRVLHHHGWHRVRVSYMPDGTLHRCHWCGLTQFTPLQVHQNALNAAIRQQLDAVPIGGWQPTNLTP
jgi:hypothetical protein